MMNPKRRKFLKLVGFAPLAPVVIAEALGKREPKPRYSLGHATCIKANTEKFAKAMRKAKACDKEASSPFSYIKDCLFIPREDQQGVMFDCRSDGLVEVHLDSYAIVPREEYERLASIAGGQHEVFHVKHALGRYLTNAEKEYNI
jgi:hypothetical protein